MPTRHKVSDVDTLSSDGSRVIAEIDGLEIAVFRIEGEYHAIANHCIHQGGPLCEGPLRGEYELGEDGLDWRYDTTEKNISCPWHGWKFDVPTGRNVRNDQYRIPTFEVEVDDGEIFVLR